MKELLSESGVLWVEINGKRVWKPIETAPMDGQHLLLFQPEEGGSYFSTAYDDGEGYTFTGCFDSGTWYCLEYTAFPKTPTHWMELPEPPK